MCPVSSTSSSGAAGSRLLVVDDEAEIRTLLTRYFSSQGLQAAAVENGEQMRAAIASQPIDLVLLDLGLPGEDGLELVRHLRQNWSGPIIIVSGRGETVDRVVGLEIGADDYVSKPFDLRELLARVRSVLRRATATAPAAAASTRESPVSLEFAGFRLDLHARSLSDAQRQDVPLTTGEFELLRVFLEQPNRVLSRDHLMNQTRGRDSGPFDRAIDVQIRRLRSKIESDPANPRLIKSVRGAGYVFTAAVSSSRK